ncbi:hypothetical protein [Caballeronia arationis]|uniref:hypothetical protein n=1 Tax=Caballeronia arationis TaxID=1777142 RepID=UPI00141ED89A|nr:hypothetical protein [Caballeronia arationis]
MFQHVDPLVQEPACCVDIVQPVERFAQQRPGHACNANVCSAVLFHLGQHVGEEALGEHELPLRYLAHAADTAPEKGALRHALLERSRVHR